MTRQNGDIDRTSAGIQFPEDPKEIRKTVNRKKRKNLTPGYIVLTAAAIVLTLLVIYELFYTTRFSALSQRLFVMVNMIAMIALLIVDLIVFLAIRTKNFKVFIASAVILALTVGVGGYAGWALTRVDSNLNEITAKEHDTDINVSLVIYTKGSGEPIMEETDLDGKTVGYVNGTDAGTIGKTRLESEGMNINFKNFYSFADTFKALVSEEIDCAILPANYANVIGTEEQLEPFVPDTAAISTFRESVVQTGTDGAAKDLTAEPFTVLITGENEGLADTIIVVSVNPVAMKVTMTSIARDSYVPITCYNYASSKINSAHAVSEGCMVDTVELLTGIDIDYTVEFNFASVIQVVDAVGGVDVYNPVEFDGQCWDVELDALVVLPIPAGHVHLNGQEALGFVRERYAFEEGDFARQQHQQEVIQEIIRRVMETRDPNTYLKILDAAGANIRTNLSTDQMVQFISYAMKKAKRYYDQGNPTGVMNIIKSRIAGWSAQQWDDSLGMYLYIYNPFNGAAEDTYNYVSRNIDLYTLASIPESVSWSADSALYEPPVISYDWYDGEVGATVIGGPDPGTDPVYEDPTYVEPVEPVIEPEPTGEPVIEPEPTEEPVVEPEPVPTEEPVEPVPGE